MDYPMDSKIWNGKFKTIVFNGSCLDVMMSEQFAKTVSGRKVCIVTDPPFNVGYHYKSYKDNMSDSEYYEFLSQICTMHGSPYVVIHYPEALYRLSHQTGVIPERVVSWVYNSNTAKQHRDIAFFGVKPDFNKVKQPYKNLNDKRIKERIARGIEGGRLYDWWEINQVKNVSKKEINHPCVMPTEVMERVIGILPEEYLIVDPFLGSGTTGIACKKHNRDFIGIEMDADYYQLAKNRIFTTDNWWD